MTKLGEVCRHGSLARQCEICEIAENVTRLEGELDRLRLPPDETMSEHPGCVACMKADTTVRPGQVCSECGDRLPTKREYEAVRLERELDESQRGQRELCVAIGNVTDQLAAAQEKITRQAERIRYLEGATNHADGTPLSKALAECEALRADALRYRWLRNIPGNEDMLLALETACSEPDSPEAFDAAIDTARSKS